MQIAICIYIPRISKFEIYKLSMVDYSIEDVGCLERPTLLEEHFYTMTYHYRDIEFLH